MSKKMTVAEYLSHAILLSGKTQKEVAADAGFNKPNVLSMMKQGLTKVPIYSIPALAKACNVDPVFFVRLAMQEYHPEVWAVISGSFGEALTDDERAVLDSYREEKMTKMEDSSEERRSEKV